MTERLRRRIPIAERFEQQAHPEPNTGCWLWGGTCNRSGYGQIGAGGAGGPKIAAHRFAYGRWRGPIPRGLVIDHLCRVRCCVNPDQLEAVSHRENCMRGMAPSVVVARSGRCSKGHELTPANTANWADGPRCVLCVRAVKIARRLRRALPAAPRTR
jgi:hypothetical protein